MTSALSYNCFHKCFKNIKQDLSFEICDTVDQSDVMLVKFGRHLVDVRTAEH